MGTNVSYQYTVCGNRGYHTHEFGFNFHTAFGTDVNRARALCAAVVRHRLGLKTGSTRKQLDALAEEFFGCSWQELSTGVADGDEEV